MEAAPFGNDGAVAGVRIKLFPEKAGLLASVITASVPSKLPGVPPASLYKATPEVLFVARFASELVANPEPLKFT